MDAKRFDQLARTVSRDGSRRGVLRLLAVTPLAGALAALLGAAPDEVAADGSVAGVGGHHRRKNGKGRNHKRVGADNHKHPGRRRKHRNKRNHDHHHKHKKKPCQPESTARTCDGKCGEVQNNCQQPIDCGDCACNPPCPACQHCNLTSLDCESDPEAIGDDCGQGRICQPDGTCACSGESCGDCGVCGADGSCQGCTICCDGGCCSDGDVCHTEPDQCCRPASKAETCDGQCGDVENNCGEAVDCGPCDCSPACPLCQVCNAGTGECEPDPAQVGDACGDGLVCQGNGACACSGQSCGGCRVCDGGTCVPDTSIVCTAQDQCHEAGDCDPNTGQCTNPRKDDGTRCEAADPCTVDAACQQGICTGTPRDCSSEDDPCNDGVCQADGSCGKAPKPNGTGCNADNTSCTDGDSCQGGICTPGAGVDCSSQNDQCNTGVCDPATGQCGTAPRPDGTACDDGDACTGGDACQGGTCAPGTPLSCPVCQACRGGSCQNASSDARCATVCCGGVCCDTAGVCDGEQCPVICLALREACDPGDNLCCDASCGSNLPNCGDDGNRCCHETRGTCGDDCECCGISFCENSQCCSYTGSPCESATDCCQNVFNQQACVANRCCALPDQPCEQEGDCCDGICDPENGVCVDCLGLQQECESSGQCCQSGEGTACEPAFDFDIPTCCHPPGGSCSSTRDCCGGQACCNGVCCSVDQECVANTCQGICRQYEERCDTSSECCAGFSCRHTQVSPFPSICRPANCWEPLEGGCHEGMPCCEGECTPDGLGGSFCCSLTGGECHDLGRFFPGGHCCGTNVCNGADRCAPCRSLNETCAGVGTASNCCNTAGGALVLLCHEGTCVPCPGSGQPCVGGSCCSGLCSNGICP